MIDTVDSRSAVVEAAFRIFLDRDAPPPSDAAAAPSSVGTADVAGVREPLVVNATDDGAAPVVRDELRVVLQRVAHDARRVACTLGMFAHMRISVKERTLMHHLCFVHALSCTLALPFLTLSGLSGFLVLNGNPIRRQGDMFDLLDADG